ncbi:hypothetical protein STEG23_022927 [Scotinomys teguina]
MTVTPLGRDQDCSLKIREVPSPWFLDPGGWSKTAAVSLYFIFPGICTLSLEHKQCEGLVMGNLQKSAASVYGESRSGLQGKVFHLSEKRALPENFHRTDDWFRSTLDYQRTKDQGEVEKFVRFCQHFSSSKLEVLSSLWH